MEDCQFYYIYGKNERNNSIILKEIINDYINKKGLIEKEDEIIYNLKYDYIKGKKKYNYQKILIYENLEEMKGNSIEIDLEEKLNKGKIELIILTSYNSYDYYKWTHDLIKKYSFKIINMNEKILIVN